MLKKFKLALVSAAVLVGGAAGIAAAQPGGKLDDADRASMKEEFHARMEARKAEALAKYDADKDGKLDQNERAAMKADRQAELFKKLDKDGNGVLSLDEFQAMHQHRQGRMGGFHRHGRGGRGQGRGGFGRGGAL